MTDIDTFSATSIVSQGPGSISFPMVQGMGFVTAIYNGQLTPRIRSPIGIDTVARLRHAIRDDLKKYKVVLANGMTWAVYVTLPDPSSSFDITVDPSTNSLVGTNNDAVKIQLAVDMPGFDTFYDKAAGMYPTSGSLYGSVNPSAVAYHGIRYTTGGSSVGGTTLMFALPHHLQAFTQDTAGKRTDVTLDSTTKGNMVGYLTNSFDFTDTLPSEIQFLPWSQASAFGKGLSYSASALREIAAAANEEIKENIPAQVYGDSTYFSGKALDKFSYILLVVDEILQDKTVTLDLLNRLKEVFATFADNKQTYPLIYDTKYKGITSSASLKDNDNNADFGSPLYNDHHFHYGYFIHAAAVIAHVDKKNGGNWAEQNKGWVNALLRDTANPSHSDNMFPVFRYFDWYHGHSWAKGLFASADGKDEESSSEDYNFAYAMKLWGRAIGDASMEARGDLMLAVMKRSLNNYFLMQADNTIQPANFIGNKVPGITFENKLHHTTYFGTNLEYIQGIHMLPITPVSSYIRNPTFVQQEWDSVLTPILPSVNSGWLGVLRLNQALYDPKSAYDFFSSPSFQNTYLDGGASLTWSLAFAAGVGGSHA